MDFDQTKQAYARLKDEFQQGRLTAEEFEGRVNEMVVRDARGTMWQIGVKTGTWYRFDGQQWIEDIPPQSEPSGEADHSAARREPAFPDQAPPRKGSFLTGFLLAGFLGVCFLAAVAGIWLAWDRGLIPLALPTNAVPPIASVAPTSPALPVSLTPINPLVIPVSTALPGFAPHQVLFQDDFSTIAGNWPDIRVDDEVNTYPFDGLYYLVVYPSGFHALAHPGLNFPGDVRVEVDAGHSSGSQFDEFGPVCRYAENSDGTASYYYFAIATDGLGVIYKVDHDVKNLVITDPPKNRSDVIFPGNQDNHIRADCVGEALTLFVNDQPLIGATDSALTGGDAGLRADSETGNTEITFDNFIVYSVAD